MIKCKEENKHFSEKREREQKSDGLNMMGIIQKKNGGIDKEEEKLGMKG